MTTVPFFRVKPGQMFQIVEESYRKHELRPVEVRNRDHVTWELRPTGRFDTVTSRNDPRYYKKISGLVCEEMESGRDAILSKNDTVRIVTEDELNRSLAASLN